MKFAWSKHSLEQLERRGISASLVENVLKDPDQVITEGSQTIYQAVIEEQKKSYLVRIFVNSDKNPPLIITACKTSKIGKYYEG